MDSGITHDHQIHRSINEEDYLGRKKSGICTPLLWMAFALMWVIFGITYKIQTWWEIQFLEFHIWRWEGMLLVAIGGRILATWAVFSIVLIVERKPVWGKSRLLCFAHGAKESSINAFWSICIVLGWHFLKDTEVEKESNILLYVEEVLLAFMFQLLLWLAKDLLFNAVVCYFQNDVYFERFRDALFDQEAVDSIFTAEPEGEAETAAFILNTIGRATILGNDRSLHRDERKEINRAQKFSAKDVSAGTMMRLMNIINRRRSFKLEERTHESRHKTDREAKIIAKYLFQKVAKSNPRYITENDMKCYMDGEKLRKFMKRFEGAAENNMISKRCFENYVVNVYRERRSLEFILNDRDTAIENVRALVNIIVGLGTVVTWILILGIAKWKFLLFLGSQIFLWSFFLEKTRTEVCGDVRFLFVKRDFDVGDMVEMDGQQLTVEKINILTTIFSTLDNDEIIMTNSALATKSVYKLPQNAYMGDAYEFLIDDDTPTIKIAIIRERITSYVQNNETWYAEPVVTFMDAEEESLEPNMCNITIWLRYQRDIQDIKEKSHKRSQLISKMKDIFRDLEVQFSLHSTDYNVRTLSGDHFSLN